MITPLLLLTACSSTSEDETNNAAVEDRTEGAAGTQNGEGYEGQTGGYNDSGMGDDSAMNGQSYSGDPLSDPNSPLSIRTIYLDYDSAQISTEGQSALNASCWISVSVSRQGDYHWRPYRWTGHQRI